MIKTKELEQLIENTGLTRQEFSLRLNRYHHYVNVYLSNHKSELPIKSCCLIAYHFKSQLRKVIGKERLKSILEISKRVNFKPEGETPRRRLKPLKNTLNNSLPTLELQELKGKVVNASNCKKFSEILTSVRGSLRKDHPELEKRINTFELGYIVGKALKGAGVGQDKLIEIKASEID